MTPTLQNPDHSLVLASASAVRARLLEAAGLTFAVTTAPIDETAVKAAIRVDRGDVDAAELAMILAQAKAASASETAPGALVIGADQTLSCAGRIFDKPRDREEARETLVSLRGRTHTLHTAVACARDGDVAWHYQADAQLTMRGFSNEFLGRYMAAVGDAATTSVGAYQLEGPGAQLFSSIDGDYFTILGLPLLPLLDFLRAERVIEA